MGIDDRISLDFENLKYTNLTKKEQIELACRAQDGDRRAFLTLIYANQRLVCSIAQKYASYATPIEDLIQWGNIGLIRAIDKYDPQNFRTKFGTHAVFYIKQQIFLAKSEECLVKKPHYVYDIENKIKRAIRSLSVNGHEPADEEISALTEIPLKKIKQVRKIMSCSILSLNQNTKDGLNTEFGSLVASSYSLEEQLFEEEKKSILREGVNNLGQERDLIIGKFGLFGEQKKTIKELMQIYCVTRMSIDNKKRKAIKKLRMSAKILSLKEGLA